MSTTEGSKIRMLSTTVANKIAAGEVVERPAAAVKELLENALDAGATRIDVVVTAGGRKLISVADNGSGMNRDDAIMAPERQATSKIREVDDIEHIATLGFRGEALASIASVSRFTLSTRRPADDFGTEVTIIGGTMMDVKDCGCPPGTCIEARDLFFNVPARRNFLRSFQTEQAYIRNMFVIHAIAYPHIAMSLKCDGDVAYQLAPAESLHDRLLELIGHEELERLVPVDTTLGLVHVHGYAGIPTWTRADRNGQYVYINNRPATAPAIQNAINQAYPHLDNDRKPVLYLFIDLPPEQVDVNVHPTKREVRFRCIADVRDAVIAALTAALNRSGTPMPANPAALPHEPDRGTVPTMPPPPAWNQLGTSPTPTFSSFRMPPAETHPAASPPVRPAPSFPFEAPSPETFGGAPFTPASASEESEGGLIIEIPSGAPWTRFRVVGRLSTGYALLETNDGYTVLDPAAAHERVLYEKLMGLAGDAHPASQRLLIPQTVELKPLDSRRIENILPILQEMGFGIEPFGKDTFVIDSLPDIIADVSCDAVLLDTATALEEAGNKRGRERWREEIVAKAASRAAVRTCRALSPKELNAIILDLAICSMPYTSPTGRPTMIYTSFRELDRRFGKT